MFCFDIGSLALIPVYSLRLARVVMRNDVMGCLLYLKIPDMQIVIRIGPVKLVPTKEQ